MSETAGCPLQAGAPSGPSAAEKVCARNSGPEWRFAWAVSSFPPSTAAAQSHCRKAPRDGPLQIRDFSAGFYRLPAVCRGSGSGFRGSF